MSLENVQRARSGTNTSVTSAKYRPVTCVGDIETGVAASEHKEDEVDEDIIRACIASNAHEFIKTFPQGYQTDVGEGSVMVSGGQKQRIAIATLQSPPSSKRPPLRWTL